MLAAAPKDVPLREQSHLTLQTSHPDQLPLEDRLCPGCKKSAVNEQGGLVVAFGQSFFHVDCFKCAKCRNQVTADTNLLLLSDGSPICANCSYSCNICKLPILDEAIMTGDDSYHAHCFKCKVCSNRIDELVFAKTSQGIYCMNCHNERMIKIRKHAQKKAERERAANSGSGSSRSRETQAKHFHREQESRSISQKPLNAPSSFRREDNYPSDTSRSPTRNIYDVPSPFPPQVPVTIIPPADLESNNLHQSADDRLLPAKSNTVPTLSPSISLSRTRSRRGSDTLRSATASAKQDLLPDSGRTALGNGNLLSQTLSVTSRQDKRRSINPGLSISLFKDVSGAQVANHSPITQSLQFQDARHSPTSPFLNAAEKFPSSSRNARSRSNSATSAHSPNSSKGDDDTVVMASPPSISTELEPTPKALQRISQYSNHSTISGRSLSPIDAYNPIKRSSFASTSSRAPSPSHRVDVPQGIDSDTDVETDTDRAGVPESTSRRAAPAPPPKDAKSSGAVQTSPTTTVESDGTESREEVDDNEDASSVEQTSHSTYIAPALPPIRFSMNNADFSELLSSVGGLPALKTIDTLETSRKGSRVDTPATHMTSTSITSHMEETMSFSNSEKEGRLTPVMTVTPASEDLAENTVITKPETNRAQNARSESVLSKLREAVKSAKDRGTQQLQVDIDVVDAVIEHIESRDATFTQLKSKVDGMNRESKRFIAGMTVAQAEYDQELKARRDAEAEVTRLRVLLSGQAVRLAALSGDSRKQELRQQLSKELHDNLAGLEHDLSRLKVERDMALAEVEELTAKTSNGNASEVAPANVSRALTRRLEAIRTQYQRELLPLTEQKEALCREIAELKSVRDMFLEETTVLNARNEELAQLSAVYARRIENGHEILSRPPPDSTRSSHDTSRGHQHQQSGLIVPSLSASTSGSSTVYDDNSDSRHMKILNSPPEFSTPAKGKFKWPGSKPRDVASPGSHQEHMARKPVHGEHNFQQLSVLRFARCDHCGDKMWGSQLRCNICATSIHVRCIANVQLPCTEKHRSVKEDPEVLPPSMFGRDLLEQVRADSKDVERQVPIIVEKCIHAVEARALDYEGIYRKTGGSSQSKAITQLFERGDYEAFDLCDSDRFTDVCSITSVLKTYFRSLPVPLLTFDLHDQFIQAVTIRDGVAKQETLFDLINSLPNEYYYTLQMLMMHLHRVGREADINLMTGRNLGVVFGPTLMRSRDPGAEFSDMAGKALFIEWLVENAPAVFRLSE